MNFKLQAYTTHTNQTTDAKNHVTKEN